MNVRTSGTGPVVMSSADAPAWRIAAVSRRDDEPQPVVLSTVTTRTSVPATNGAPGPDYAPRRAVGREAPLSSNRFERKPGVRTSLIGFSGEVRSM